MIFVPIFFAFFLWFGGYLMTARFISTTGVNSDNDEKIITPPKWLYYICGAPVSKKYPKGAMRVYAFHSQIFGIFLGLYLIWYVISRPPTSVNVIGLGLSTLTSYLVTAYVSKHYAVRNRSGSPKGRK
jgi:hypothetical protein